MGTQTANFSWIKVAERMPDSGQLIVKRWNNGAVWAGRYSGTEKDSSFDAWCPLPEEN